MEIINKYSNYIDLFEATENCQQPKHLNSKLELIKSETKWIISCDLDEFLFSKEDYKTIPDVINKFNSQYDNLGLIRIPWFIFNSNGHIEQPKYVIPSFTNRKDYSKNNVGHPCKWVANTEFLKEYEVCWAKTSGHPILSNGEHDKNVFIPKHRKIMITNNDNDDLLQLNHYVLQSKNWFFEVKNTRGDVRYTEKEWGNFRDEKYFKKYDNEHNGYTDELLKNKKYPTV